MARDQGGSGLGVEHWATLSSLCAPGLPVACAVPTGVEKPDMFC